MIGTIGESLVDIVNGKERIGGSPYNVALAASRLGAPVTFFGKISADERGRRLLERMIDNGVLSDPQMCNAEEPTLCSKAVLDKEGKASYVFDYEGTAACSFTKEELYTSLCTESDIDMLLIGSISLVMEPGCKAIMPAIRKMKRRPVLFLDPNVRPSLIKDPAAYRKMIMDLAGECELVRVSDEDLAYLLPGISTAEAELKMRKACRGCLIVTRGAYGSTWYSKGFSVDTPCFNAGKIVDTIGCGDTFDGAVMAWLERNGLINSIASLTKQDVQKMMDYASKAAGLNCLFEGCEPPRRVGNADDLE